MQLALLLAAVLVTSAISGAIGMGGGTILLVVMASLLDPAIVVPLHGIVQMVSNGTRAVSLLSQVKRSILALYVPAMIAGAFVGVRLYAGADATWYRPAIGGFVLASLLWDAVKPKRLILPMWVFVPAGLVGGVLTVALGAAGPFLAAFFLRDDLDRRQVVATKAAIQFIGHLIKIPAFLSIGFNYLDHLQLVVLLPVAAVAGTLLGTVALDRLGETWFRRVFRIVLAALAIRLIGQAVLGGR